MKPLWVVLGILPLIGFAATTNAQPMNDILPEVQMQRETAPRSFPYEPGDDVPDGYRVVTTYNGPLLGSGGALFAFHYVLAVVLSSSDFTIGTGSEERDDARNDALIVPLMGPFIALGTEADRPVEEQVLFALDGIAQVASFSVAMSGLMLKQQWLLEIQPTGVRVSAEF